ncbi:hypothetical protein ALC57_04617 [Trachymyrmex cornetzi]|uniref:Uncharacterized protein n=1 Tax=Trachymyrmex cornetzi TaxID=471704 RepID=A0A195EC86_9HYME|nr:hypothetical protein ALC57_04617 [Trachymyrmex cornetzi]
MHEYTVRELLTQHRGEPGGKPEVFGQGATAVSSFYCSSSFVHDETSQPLSGFFLISLASNIKSSINFVVVGDIQYEIGRSSKLLNISIFPFGPARTIILSGYQKNKTIENMSRVDWKTRFHRASTLRNFKEISRPFNSNNGQPDHPSFSRKIRGITSSDLANSRREKGFKSIQEMNTCLSCSTFQSNSVDMPHFLNRATK